MKFSHRNFNTNYSRPKPHTHFDEKNNSLIITSVWGQPVDPTEFTESILNFYNSKMKDADYTSPFGVVDHLDFHENTLRTAVLLAHKSFYNKYNHDELVSGLELCLILKLENTLYKVQIGQPHILVKRNSSLNILSTTPDLSSEFSIGNKNYSPLPHRLLGVSKDIDLNIRKFHVKKNDQILFINRSQIYPFELSTAKNMQLGLDKISDYLVSQNADLPFWLGLLNIN